MTSYWKQKLKFLNFYGGTKCINLSKYRNNANMMPYMENKTDVLLCCNIMVLSIILILII